MKIPVDIPIANAKHDKRLGLELDTDTGEAALQIPVTFRQIRVRLEDLIDAVARLERACAIADAIDSAPRIVETVRTERPKAGGDTA